jgi:formylglycine-generating enzyme required for sulfatase activity
MNLLTYIMEQSSNSQSRALFIKKFAIENISFKMIPIAGGSFVMGASANDTSASIEEKPKHHVTVSDFYLGQTLVTQELWQLIMGSNPSYLKGSKRPVESVNLADCKKFIKKLSSLLHVKFRLPTEAEWEYAARGGQLSNSYLYAGSDDINKVAWYYKNSDAITHEVAMKEPNELGLYDMMGNVNEWCSDWFATSYYSVSPKFDPQGPALGKFKVIRGGSFVDRLDIFRFSFRSYLWPTGMTSTQGLRLAMDMDE